MSRYRKKPVVIDAMQWTGSNGADLAAFLQGALWIHPADGAPEIQTLEGNLEVAEGDYVIRGVKGEFYPCKPDIFEMTYEVAESGE